MSLPSATFQTFTNLSAAPLTSDLPSPEKSTLWTVSLCAFLISLTAAPVWTFHSLSSPLREGSPLPVASSLPSGLKRTVLTRPVSGEVPVAEPMVRISFHSGCMFHTMILPSLPAEMTASAAKATAFTAPACPW